MKPKTGGRQRSAIASKVRRLRLERRWTQAQLARLLGLSQNRLSEIERGQGSFSAEQFLLILKNFNVPAEHFDSAKGERESKLQNALARLGASHLQESREVLPSEDLREVVDVVREVLVSAESPRLVAALAPVVVRHAHQLNLNRLHGQLAELGLARRLGWVLENIRGAVRHELARLLTSRGSLQFRRAEALLENFLRQPVLAGGRKSDDAEDILDADLMSRKSLDQVRESRSDFSRRWGILTRLQPEDFVKALREARGNP